MNITVPLQKPHIFKISIWYGANMYIQNKIPNSWKCENPMLFDFYLIKVVGWGVVVDILQSAVIMCCCWHPPKCYDCVLLLTASKVLWRVVVDILQSAVIMCCCWHPPKCYDVLLLTSSNMRWFRVVVDILKSAIWLRPNQPHLIT